MKRFNIILFAFVVFLQFNNAFAGRPDALKANEELLNRLDSIIAAHDSMVARKENRIEGLKRTLHTVESDRDRHGVVRQIFDEYYVYDSDSALRYATLGLELARRTSARDNNLLAEWKLRRSFIFVVQGLFDEAMVQLQEISREGLSDRMLCRYYQMMEYIYSMRSLYIQTNHDMCMNDIVQSNLYRDSIHAIDSNVSAEYPWAAVAVKVERDSFERDDPDARALRLIVDRNETPSRTNATNAYWLARYYDHIGDDNLKVKYLAQAAIYDALILNREIAALQELAYWLFDHGDLNRAYTYLLYAENQTNTYHNRYRMVSLANMLPAVRDAYRAEIEKRDKRMHTLVWVLTVIGLILAGAIGIIFVENRRLHRARTRLSELNSELNATVADRDSAIEELERTNSELSAANTQKLGVLGYAFRLTADYINSLEEYRKKLLRKYKVNQISELGALLNDPEIVKEQYHSFYEGFDKMVLSIFPDFIQEYNAAVSDDAPAEHEPAPDRPRILTTRQRIHALRRLGVDKSADIARMLNVSIRTVYNNRTPDR